MAQEHSASTSEHEVVPAAFLPFGEASVGLQRELLQAYQRWNRIWLERMQVEMMLWTKLVSDLASSKSPADVLQAYADRMTRQFRMSAEDGRHILNDYQEIARKFAEVNVVRASARAIHDSERERGYASEPRVTH